MSDAVTLVEVGPRDGLQNEATPLTVQLRIDLIERLIAAGVTVIEAGSFVSPRWVPQMADTDRVLAGLQGHSGVRLPVLVPNLQGLEAALACGCDEVAVFAAASETFSRRNINCSIADSLARFQPVLERAQACAVRVRGYVSCVLGCPYEGPVAPAAVATVAERLHQMGCFEISLGDTIGTGTAGSSRRMLQAVAERVPLTQLALHAHDTYGQALANILAALDAGVRVFDASVSGLGGCPYARGASGNVASEDVVYLLNGLGLHSGIDLDALVDAGAFISGVLDRPNGSKTGRALLARRQAPD